MARPERVPTMRRIRFTSACRHCQRTQEPQLAAKTSTSTKHNTRARHPRWNSPSSDSDAAPSLEHTAPQHSSPSRLRWRVFDVKRTALQHPQHGSAHCTTAPTAEQYPLQCSAPRSQHDAERPRPRREDAAPNTAPPWLDRLPETQPCHEATQPCHAALPRSPATQPCHEAPRGRRTATTATTTARCTHEKRAAGPPRPGRHAL